MSAGGNARTAGLLPFVLVSFTATSLITRHVVGDDLLDAGLLTAVRFLAGAVTLLVLAAARRERVEVGRRNAVPGLWLGVYAFCISYGYLHIGAAAGTFVFYAFVLLALVVDHVRRGGPVPRRRVGGALIALAPAGLAWAVVMGACTTAFASVAWYACQRRLSFSHGWLPQAVNRRGPASTATQCLTAFLALSASRREVSWVASGATKAGDGLHGGRRASAYRRASGPLSARRRDVKAAGRAALLPAVDLAQDEPGGDAVVKRSTPRCTCSCAPAVGDAGRGEADAARTQRGPRQPHGDPGRRRAAPSHGQRAAAVAERGTRSPG